MLTLYIVYFLLGTGNTSKRKVILMTVHVSFLGSKHRMETIPLILMEIILYKKLNSVLKMKMQKRITKVSII